MGDFLLTDEEAKLLVKMPKIKAKNKKYQYPDLGGQINIELKSQDKKEDFMLDIGRGRIDLNKTTYQNRARNIVPLVRLDFGSPHRNPDGKEIGSPHLHIYKMGALDKWAYDIPENMLRNVQNHAMVLEDFMTYRNIIDPPEIEGSLFT